MRSCMACGRDMTVAATFCTHCGTEALPEVAKPAPNYCASCGVELVSGARFCSGCGTATEAVPAVAPAAEEIANAPEPANRWLMIGGLALVAALALALWFNRYELLGLERPPEVASNASATMGEETLMFAITTANVRDRATSKGSRLVNKLARGTKVSGTIELGEDGVSSWLRLADDGGFVSAVNLAASPPPALIRSYNKAWFAPSEIAILSRPEDGAPVLETAQPGAEFQLAGLTESGFGEVLMKNGGVGYFNAAGMDLNAASAQPIGLELDVSRCSYGREFDLLFRKLGQEAQRSFDLAAKQSYSSDEAKDEALSAIEAKSSFLRLNRSFIGLTVSGIGLHTEQTSVYFSNPPGQVKEVFAKLYTILPDGSIDAVSDSPLAALSATFDEASGYGKTALNCGV